MTRKDPERVVEHVTLAEIGGGQEVKVEARLADPCRGKGAVQMHRNAHALPFGSDLDAVTQVQIRIAGGSDQLVGPCAALASDECWDGIPLFRSREQSDLAVGGDALAMQNDFDSAHLLVAEDFVKRVLVGKHAQSLRLEIVQIVQMKVGGHQGVATPRGKDHEADFAVHELPLFLRVGGGKG